VSHCQTEAEEVVQRIFRLFRDRGDACYGEEITQREHALQCALLASQAGDPPELVVACLLHDVGHLLAGDSATEPSDDRDLRHEDQGARWLEAFFPPEVTEPIRLHVAAKRYLCWRSPAYYEGLSPASQRSLQLQGGPMTEAEARQFKLHPQHQLALRLREYDDQGKIPGLQLPALWEYADEVRRWVLVR
jgi:[1-hydroxy-2-(trimethylamino)ethyl]phosphonate dioxygenase